MKIDWLRGSSAVKRVLVMKLTLILLTAAISVHASGVSQNISLVAKKARLEEVFEKVKQQTGYYIFFTNKALKNAKPVTITANNMPMTAFLDKLFADQPLVYTIASKTISVFARPPVPAVLPVIAADTTPVFVLHGRVTDNTGKPLENATVAVQGTNLGTSTNRDGMFSLRKIDGNAVLLVSFIGHQPQTIPVQNRRELFIKLAPSESQLDETVVIAYGTTTKRMNTGDVTTITSKDIQKNPVNNVLQAIQGKVPGLFVQQVTGQPGGAFNLRLRNAANFSTTEAGGPQPLIIVDGVTFPGGKLPLSTNVTLGTQTFLQGGSGLNYLNPNDIESINILKDADATSLYGSQGAYGVILITTKKAKAGPSIFDVNIYTGISVLGPTPTLLNTEQYLALRREAIANDGLTPANSDLDVNGTWPEDRYQDFRKELLGNAANTSNINLTYSGGDNNTNYLVSGSFRNNGNIQRSKGASTDGSLRFALNTSSSNNKFQLSLSGTYVSSVNDMVPIDFSSNIALMAPNAPPLFLPDGSINWEQGLANIAKDIFRTYRNVTNNLVSSVNLRWKPVKNITLYTDLSYNNITSKEFIGYPSTTKPPDYANAAAEATSIVHQYNIRNVTMSPYAEYRNTIFGKGDLNVKVGGRIDDRLNYSTDIKGEGFASDALLSNPAVATKVTSLYTQTPYRDIGAYAIMKFIWDQKYLINLNGRRDGSTRFGPGKKFGNFGSVATAWIFSEEPFMKNIYFMNYGKIRVSTGFVGGDAIGDFAYLSKYTTQAATYAGKTVLFPGGLFNPQLSWEKNWNSQIGLELGFLNDRLYVEANYYRNIASNQLIDQPLASVTGFPSMPVNSDAKIRTSGWEFVLNTTNIKTKDFSWSSMFNVSIPTSKLVKMPVNTTLPVNFVLDKPVTGIVLYNYAGINPETGNFSYTNAAGVTKDYDGTLKPADKTEFRDLAPRYFGGFQNAFRYKQWSLDVTFTFTSRLGKNMLAQNNFPVGLMGVNGPTFWQDRWQKAGDVTNIPRLGSTIAAWLPYLGFFPGSTGAYSDASYARLQNLSLTYNFSGNWLSKVGMKGFRIYLQGQNLLTISKFDGLDPENLNAGVIPPLRVFTAGLNCTF